MLSPPRSLAGQPIGWTGLGTQKLGASMTKSIAERIFVIHAALDAGVALIDTSDVYAPNRYWINEGERLVGEALRQWSGDRSKLVIATKGGHILGRHPIDIRQNGRPEHLRAACEESLKALGVDVIDLYQLHSVDSEVPLAETVGGLADLQRAGKIRHIGLSNCGRRQISEAQTVAPIVSVQNQFSLSVQNSRRVALWCAEVGITFMCWSPLGRDGVSELGTQIAPVGLIARRLGVTPQQVVLAWLVALSPTAFPLPGATTAEQASDNLAVHSIDLTPDDIAAIGSAADEARAKL